MFNLANFSNCFISPTFLMIGLAKLVNNLIWPTFFMLYLAKFFKHLRYSYFIQPSFTSIWFGQLFQCSFGQIFNDSFSQILQTFDFANFLKDVFGQLFYGTLLQLLNYGQLFRTYYLTKLFKFLIRLVLWNRISH